MGFYLFIRDPDGWLLASVTDDRRNFLGRLFTLHLSSCVLPHLGSDFSCLVKEASQLPSRGLKRTSYEVEDWRESSLWSWGKTFAVR